MTRYAQRTLIQQGTVANWGKAAAGIGVVEGYGVATGGTSYSVTVGSQAYTLVAFTADANLVVSSAGLFDVLLVGGGGGSGSGTYGGGGGGGGGVIGIQATQTIYLPAATYAVDVGAGGATELVGLNSAIGSVVAVCGGGFGGTTGALQPRGSGGGSGGGGCDNRIGGRSVFLLGGFDGGNASAASPSPGAGGGGANGAGGNSTANTNGGAGGNGKDIYPFANSTSVLTNPYYAAAGGGGGYTGTVGTAGNGGVAGSTGTGIAGVNYGAGAGGGVSAGAAGAAGLVLVRFKV